MSKEGYVILTLRFIREGNKWLGECEETGTATFARTLRTCETELRELVTEHLNALEEVGERDRFFEEWNIEFHRTRPTTPRQVTLRVMDDWAHLTGNDLASGPFFQPGLFPIGKSHKGVLETAGV